MKLGKAKYSGEKKEIFKIKDGDNVFRILPPMGNLADAGVWARYFRVVWGYKDSNGKLRPFVSPRVVNFKTKMVEVDCAAFNRTERLKNELTDSIKKAKEFAANKQPLPKELKDRIEELKELVGSKGRFNIDSKHHMNVMTQDGKIGLLKLAGRGMQALKARFKQMEAAGVDATAVQGGRFMVIHRSGTGLDTTYSVEELKQQVQTQEHGLVEKSVPHNLDDSIISRLSQEAFELDEIYPTPTSEQVAEIVAAYERSEEEGAKVVDRIFGSNESSSSGNSKAQTKVEQRAEAVVESPQTSVTEELATNSASNVPVSEAAETLVQETSLETQTNTEVSGTVTNPAAQTDAEFLAELGVDL